VVVGGYNVEFQLAVRGGLEDTRIDFYLLDTRAEKGAEGGCYPSLFACARGTVDEEMGEVTAVCLGRVSKVLVKGEGEN